MINLLAFMHRHGRHITCLFWHEKQTWRDNLRVLLQWCLFKVAFRVLYFEFLCSGFLCTIIFLFINLVCICNIFVIFKRVTCLRIINNIVYKLSEYIIPGCTLKIINNIITRVQPDLHYTRKLNNQRIHSLIKYKQKQNN